MKLEGVAHRMTAAESGIAGNTSAVPWAASHGRDGHEHQFAANVSHSQVNWIAVFGSWIPSADRTDGLSPLGQPWCQWALKPQSAPVHTVRPLQVLVTLRGRAAPH